MLGLAPCARALSDAEAIAGRLLVRKYADVIVTVKAQIFIKVTVGERTMPMNEQKVDQNGTVITTGGLVATSLTGLDPRSIFEATRPQNTGGEPVELGQTEVKNLKIRFSDGTEVRARIVWKDEARDLALVAPEDGALPQNRPLSYVNLQENQAGAVILGTYFHLSRANEALQRAAMVRPTTVTAILERPKRLFLVTTDQIPDAVGCPVFDAEGRFLGIALRFTVKGLPSGSVVVPAGEILEMASRAANS